MRREQNLNRNPLGLEENYMSRKYLVAWDFSKKPIGAFYRILADEFGSSHPGGDYELVTQTKKLPFRQSYGLNAPTFIQAKSMVQRNGNAFSVRAT